MSARVGAGAAAVAAALALGACGSAGTPAASAPDPPLAAGTVAVDGTVYATLAMGQLGVPNNTFWELVADRDGRWSAVTPPDIATNGGLVLSVGEDQLTTGVLPSQSLGFSPLAGSSDRGGRWSPGVLPWSLVRVPDALAVDGPRSLAIVSGHPERLVESRDAFGTWTTISTAVAVAASSPRCGLLGLTAVDAGGTRVLAGGACSTGSSVVPLFERVGRPWRQVGVSVPGVRDVDVLRIGTSRSGTVVLATCRVEGRATVLVLRSSDAFTTWRVAVLGTVTGVALSTEVDQRTGDADVLVRRPDGALVDLLTTQSGGSRVFGVPAGTALVVTPTTTSTEALSVAGSHLVVRARTGRSWRVVQDLFVPIPYGSSG